MLSISYVFYHIFCYSEVKNPKAVSAYFSSKQTLPFVLIFQSNIDIYIYINIFQRRSII